MTTETTTPKSELPSFRDVTDLFESLSEAMREAPKQLMTALMDMWEDEKEEWAASTDPAKDTTAKDATQGTTEGPAPGLPGWGPITPQ